jgi:hypothetical protein
MPQLRRVVQRIPKAPRSPFCQQVSWEMSLLMVVV